MILYYDISNFMSWWFTQVISITQNWFSILDSFKFNGISVLQFLFVIGILTVLIVIVLPQWSYDGSSPVRTSREKSFKDHSDRLGL